MIGMDALFALGAQAGALLQARGQTVAVAESSAGGLISAALLAVPGASAYFRGGGVVYTVRARMAFLRMDRADIRPSAMDTVPALAQAVRRELTADWGLAESGAAGPNEPAGFSFVALDGAVSLARRIDTGSHDRRANMQAFAQAALQLLIDALEADSQTTP
jgi:nicotinamide-nucleotide amidase